MSQLKLTADGGGGTVAIKGPASTTGNNAFELTVPGTASGTVLTTTNPKSGSIIQAQHAFKKNSTTIAANSGFTAISGLSKPITMSNANNKIIILVTISYGQSAFNFAYFKLYDGSSEITDATSTGGTGAFISTFYHPQVAANCMLQVSGAYEFSPNDTNEHTINVYGDPQNSTLSINRRDSSTSFVSSTSSLTLLEVAA